MLIKSELEQILHSLVIQRKKCNDELAELPAGTLISSVRNGQPVYFNALGTKETYRRISINNNEDMKRGLARKKYLELQLGHIEEDIAVLRNMSKRISDISPADLMKQLPRAYKRIPQNYFFPEKSGWEAEPYVMSDYKPEKRRHLTSAGVKVRSKSEVIIAEKLHEHGVPFRYEQVLTIGDREFAPDFTVRSRSGKIFYWEHCGMTGDENYINYNRWKLSQYERAGIVPWDNLIVTYDSEDGILNIPLIESEIIYRLKG